MPRGLSVTEEPLDIARTRGITASRGLSREEIRKRFIRPRWYIGADQPVEAPPEGEVVRYTYIGGGYNPS